MSKKEAAVVLNDELFNLSMILDKAKAIGEASKEYFFEECSASMTQEKISNAGCLNDIMLEYLCKACVLVNNLGD